MLVIRSKSPWQGNDAPKAIELRYDGWTNLSMGDGVWFTNLQWMAEEGFRKAEIVGPNVYGRAVTQKVWIKIEK